MQRLVDDGVLCGADLPEGVLPEGEEWHERTRAWWTTWRTSAQAKAFLLTDWDFLLDTALMHHTMWTKNRLDLAAEVRLRAAKFGATVEDRMRLRMKVESPAVQGGGSSSAPKTAGEATVTAIDDRRSRVAAG